MDTVFTIGWITSVNIQRNSQKKRCPISIIIQDLIYLFGSRREKLDKHPPPTRLGPLPPCQRAADRGPLGTELSYEQY